MIMCDTGWSRVDFAVVALTSVRLIHSVSARPMVLNSILCTPAPPMPSAVNVDPGCESNWPMTSPLILA